MLYPRVEVEVLAGEGAVLRVHPELLHKLEADALARAHLRFGQSRRQVAMERDPSRPVLSVGVGGEVAADLCLPEGLPWEIRRVGGELILGPFIGILRFPESSAFNMQTLAILKDRILAHKQLRGVIFAFAADQLEREDGLVDGYYYHPQGDDWRAATLPIPAAVFRHVPMAPGDRDRLIDRVGWAVFNDYHPDKWEVYRWLVGDPDLAPHLPLTRWFSSWEEVAEIAGDRGQIILRPMSEAESWASVLVQRRGDGWAWRRRVNREWQTAEGGDDEALAAIDAHLEGRPTLLMQWPFPMRDGDRWTDYHVRVQKGQTARWQITGMAARRSGIGGPVANISAGGIASPGEQTLQETYKLDEPALYQLKQRIFDLALKVGERLDRSGVHLGDIAVDVGLDLDRNIWIHNVNARIPDPTVGLDVGDRLFYYRLVTQPMFYAKALAGFPTPAG